jgi:predicted transcriptional regulator
MTWEEEREDLIARLAVLEDRLETAEAQIQSIAKSSLEIFETIKAKQAITNSTIYTLIRRITDAGRAALKDGAK